ncbi:MAG: sel1 repeat family protein [Magnetococcales bacterium]|nr:sel1 repeat family protein [Magnetococcales bacterium]
MNLTRLVQRLFMSVMVYAANRGIALAQYMLGVIYDQGKGVPQDPAEAVKWFRMAAEQGYADAQFSLGGLYANGLGVARDNREALKWLRMAAEQGHEHAKQLIEAMDSPNRGSRAR